MSQTPAAFAGNFKKLLLQSVVDDMNKISLSQLQPINAVISDWEKYKASVLESRVPDLFTVPSPGKEKKERRLGEGMNRYFTALSKLFHARLVKSNINIFKEFRVAETERTDIERDSFEVIWSLLEAQVQGIENHPDEELPAVLIGNTCKFFENNFAEKIFENTSGRGTLENVKAFVERTVTNKGGLIEFNKDGEAPWAVLYFLMRAGLIKQAEEYADREEILLPISKYLRSYTRGNNYLDSDDIDLFLEQVAETGIKDIYHRAILVILTRSNEEISELQSVSLEDYLWFKLKICHPIPDAQANRLEQLHPHYRTLTLTQLQDNLKDIGPDHFSSKPLAYVLSLLSAVCYGETVFYLSSKEDFDVENLHLAIGLQNYSLLPVFTNQDSLFESLNGLMHTNMNKLVSNYIKYFIPTHPNQALIYISCLTTRQAIIKQASDLLISIENYEILKNREFYIFSSKFRQMVGEEIYTQIVTTVADYALSRGAPETPALYDMINNYSKVIETWIVEGKKEIKKLQTVWREEMLKNPKEVRGSVDIQSWVANRYPDLFNKYRRNRLLEENPELDRALQIIDRFLAFMEATKRRYFRHALNILAGSGLFPIGNAAPNTLANIRKLHNLCLEELPMIVIVALQVIEVVLKETRDPVETENLKQDMKTLSSFFSSDVTDIVKHLPNASRQCGEYSGYIRDIKGKLALGNVH